MGGGAEEQIAFAREQLERGIAAVGAMHPDVIQARLHLGILLIGAGFHEMALAEFSEAAHDVSAALGPLHPDALVARYHEMTALIQSGRPQGAARGLEELLEDHLRVFGPHHVGTFSVRSALASVLIALGHHEQADEQLAVLILEVDDSGLELEPGQKASWLLQRSHCLSDPLRFEDAIELARQAKQAASDPDSGSVAIRVAAQARALDALTLAIMPLREKLNEETRDALLAEVRREVETLREDLLSAEAQAELGRGSLNWINSRVAELSGALLVEDAGTTIPAMTSLFEELAMLRGLDVATLTAASRLGELLGESGRIEDAVTFLERVVAQVREEGLQHTSLGLILRNNLGQWLANSNRLADAVAVLRAAVDDAVSSSEVNARERETIVGNLLDRASMLGDLENTRRAAELLAVSADGSTMDAALAAEAEETDPDMASSDAPQRVRVIDLVAAGSRPQPVDAVVEAVGACARVGRPVLVERHEDGWCWALAAPSIEDLSSTLRSLDGESEDLPPFVLSSAWVVRDGLTSWRPRPEVPRPLEWWVVPKDALADPHVVLRMIGGAR